MTQQPWFTVGGSDIPAWKIRAELAKRDGYPVYSDAGPNTSNGHWITHNGAHVWIAGPPLTDEQKRLRAAYQADVAKGPDAFFRHRLRAHEHGDDPDPSHEHDKPESPLGHYQIGDGMLTLLGLKQHRGNAGWGITPFAKAYNIKSNTDFLLNDEAQDAALA